MSSLSSCLVVFLRPCQKIEVLSLFLFRHFFIAPSKLALLCVIYLVSNPRLAIPATRPSSMRPSPCAFCCLSSFAFCELRCVLTTCPDLFKINSVLSEEKPQIVVHAAAERRPDECENDPARTRRINVDATGKAHVSPPNQKKNYVW